MQYQQNPKFKGYQTACSFVMVDRAKLLPVSKLNHSAQLIYQALAKPRDVGSLVRKLAKILDVSTQDIEVDVKQALTDLCAAEFVSEVDS